MKKSLLSLILLVPVLIFSQTQIGSDIDGTASQENSGTSVSISGDGTTVAIGSPKNGPVKSHVRVFQNNGTQIGANIVGETNSDQSGYSVSLSDDGTSVAIGAPYNTGTGSNAGHVRVYKFNTPNWNQVGEDIDAEAFSDNSGWSVSLSSDGTIVAIGAPNNDGAGSNAGHVRVLKFNGTDWMQLGADIDGEAANDMSGISVSLSSDGNTVSIGATGNDGSFDSAGQVRVYSYDSGSTSWIQKGGDINGEAAFD